MESVTYLPSGNVPAGKMCSTPSGIMESVTLEEKQCDVQLYVLNAFRHHGIGHQKLPRMGQAPDGVLNAFRHHGIGHAESGTRRPWW